MISNKQAYWQYSNEKSSVQLFNESNLDTLASMDDKCVDITITSPPYDELRNYKGYCFDFENVAKELFRVTKEGGVVVWVVGDACIEGSESGTSFKQALFFKECGFNIHDTMIYEKNGAAYPANDKSTRYSQVFEYMFVFSKGKPKTINLLKDKKNRWAGAKNFGSPSNRNKDGELKQKERFAIADYGYRNNIWKMANGATYSTKDEIAFEHPAIFPEKLVHDHLMTWSNEGDVCYDPFLGSGTTMKMAFLANRNCIASEISEEYCIITTKRLKPYIQQMSLF